METTKLQKLAIYKNQINEETINELNLFSSLETVKMNYNCGFISASIYVDQCMQILKVIKKQLI